MFLLVLGAQSEQKQERGVTSLLRVGIVIRRDGYEIFREPAMYEGYERFIEVAHILKEKYGTALKDLIPTRASQIYLYGDCLSAPEKVDQAGRDIFITSGEA